MPPVAEGQQAIDQIDDQIIDLLVKRFRLSSEIGGAKRRSGQAPFDPQRMEAQQQRFVRACADRGLNAAMANQIISVIVAQVVVQRLEIFRSALGPGEDQPGTAASS